MTTCHALRSFQVTFPFDWKILQVKYWEEDRSLGIMEESIPHVCTIISVIPEAFLTYPFSQHSSQCAQLIIAFVRLTGRIYLRQLTFNEKNTCDS